ncbi:uncharacterized protein SAMN02746066_01676 [Anaerosporobacter mobilis DSM 15930]|jgi:uncharacterized protein|uniref:Radical SAM core domain-containing protein n=1 Tax=Anaerosporobacter mobilis DSM 15930 TaxID=1120996 RepID=A0A1M7I6C8_9FIRM|nr:radical SAM protein [Anaerosporobacter mobilis]SHM36093.1 uncharacterized protein SAMN02746066_01676 [Anaerosporobacter mobilis DSM 15930]
MIFNFTLDDINYFFNSETLKLFQDFIPGDVENNEKTLFINEFNKLHKVTLIISNTCNGKCIYCYEKGGNFGRKNTLMNRDDADKIIDYILRNFKSIGNVNFFGGEPTLNFDLIKYIVNRLDGNIDVDVFSIVTNGTLIDDYMITFFDKYHFKITISLDGPDYIHDKLRLNCSYNNIMKIINKIRITSIGDLLELNCTYTKYHQEHITYNELNNFFQNLGIKYYISDVVTEIDWLKLDSDNSLDLTISEKNIDSTFEKIYKNSINRNLSTYACAVIDVLIEPIYFDKFCYDIEKEFNAFFDYNGNKVPCSRFIDKNLANDYIDVINSKNNDTCLNCWARGLCKDCTADYVLKMKKEPYLDKNCFKMKLYEYALIKLVSIYKDTPEKFQIIIDNYLSNF